MSPELDVRISRQCRRAHHGDCRGCDCSCHPDGTVEVPDPEPVPPPDPIIPASEPVAPPAEPEPPHATAPRKRAARPAGTGTVSPAVKQARAKAAPVKHRKEIHVDEEVAATIDALDDQTLRRLLDDADVSYFVAELLMVDRHTVGARWRIAQEILA